MTEQTDATLRAVVNAMRFLSGHSHVPFVALPELGLIVVARWDQHDYLGCYVARIIGEA